MRMNLLNWCNSVFISKKLVFYIELVSKELNHFGVIADLFWQMVTVVDLCYFALFEDFSL